MLGQALQPVGGASRVGVNSWRVLGKCTLCNGWSMQRKKGANKGAATPVAHKTLKYIAKLEIMAERQGFEPWRRFPAYTRSRRAPSTTRPPLRHGSDAASVREMQEQTLTRQ